MKRKTSHAIHYIYITAKQNIKKYYTTLNFRYKKCFVIVWMKGKNVFYEKKECIINYSLDYFRSLFSASELYLLRKTGKWAWPMYEWLKRGDEILKERTSIHFFTMVTNFFFFLIIIIIIDEFDGTLLIIDILDNIIEHRKKSFKNWHFFFLCKSILFNQCLNKIWQTFKWWNQIRVFIYFRFICIIN